MNFGELLSGAGRIGSVAREEAQRLRDYERDRVALAEMRRMEAMRESLARGGVPETPPEMLRFGSLDYGFSEVEPPQPAPAAPTAPATSATPAAAKPAPAPVEVPVEVQPLKRRPEPVPEELLSPEQLKKLEDELAIAKMRQRDAKRPAGGLGGWGTGVGAITQTQRKQLDDQVKFLEARITKARQAVEVERARAITPAVTTPQIDNARMSDIMEHFESRGNPEAVSGAGAIGLMQVKPETAMKPGVSGVESIFDIALTVPNNPYNVADNKRTKEEAARLLRIPELNKAFGNEYFKGLLAKYGNVEHALVAYNWGPTNTNKWVTKGADPTKLPAETRQYVANIQDAYGRTDFTPSTFDKRPLNVAAPAVAVTGAPVAEPAATRGIIPAAAAAPVAAPQRVEPSAFRAQENAMPEALRQYQQQRAELVRLAKMYQQSGMGAEVQQLRGQIIGMDNDFLRMQGMQGLQEFSFGDPRRLSAVWSAYSGTSVGIQPRSDGKFNLFVGGQRYGAPMDAEELTSMARSAFDTAYQQQRAAISAEMGTEAFKSGLRVREKQAEQTADMIKQIYIERAKSAGALDAKRLELRGFDVKPSGMGDGMFVITAKDGSGAWAFNSKAATQEINGVKVPAYEVFPIKLPGLR